MEPQIDIAPIDPSVYVAPWPMWLMVSVGFVAALIVGIFLWALMRWIGKATAPAPLTPKQQALTSLGILGSHTASSDPYEFSVEVSNILRRYVSSTYQLPATSQTSPEFLASVADNPRFSREDRELLQLFLEKADLIKFARLNATAKDSEALLTQAQNFVNGKEPQA